ncbi:MAG: hypothetical protein U0570_12675 [Phycisphaerales bacterium]
MSSHNHTSDGHADAWHHHSAAEGVPQHEHAATVDTFATFQVLVGILGFTAVFILVTILYFNVSVRQQQELKIETIGAAEMALATKGQVQAELGSFGVVDADKKIVRIPIDRAMDRVVKSYQKR